MNEKKVVIFKGDYVKVLFFMNGSFSHHSTSEHLLISILERLVVRNNQVHIIQMLSPGDELTLPESIKNKSVTTEGVFVKPQKKNNFVARYINAIKNYCHCKKVLMSHADYDTVFLQSTNVAGVAVGLVRKYVKNARVVYNVQDIFPYNASFSGRLKKDGIVFKVLAAVQRYGYRNSDKIITISEDMKQTLIADGTNPDKIAVIYNWSYQDEIYDCPDYSEVSHIFDNGLFNVVYAGNIGVMQNVDILIEAANLIKNNPEICFQIIGNGVYKDRLIEKVKEYGIDNVRFWPMQPPELAPSIYSAADINVIPLMKDVYKTALPSKTATCLACGKPVIFAIGKDSLFGKRIETETNCIMTASDNPKELANAILEIKNGKRQGSTAEFFKRNCLATQNSDKYAQIVLGEGI